MCEVYKCNESHDNATGGDVNQSQFLINLSHITITQ